MVPPPANKSILALDLGEKRVGVARASLVARLAQPLTTLPNDDTLIEKLRQLIAEHQVEALVVGRPRNLRGRPTAQTEAIEQMANQLKVLGLPIYWQDETLTSHQAEQELKSRGLRYNKAVVDALAACLILEDWLRESSAATYEKV